MIIETIAVGSLETNCYIVADEKTKSCVAIDPGDQPAHVLAAIERMGCKLKYIFLTHGHFDHIRGVSKLREATGAQLVIHEADLPWLNDSSLSYGRKLPEIDTPELLAGDGMEIEVDGLVFKWLNTPGHTPGSSVILCGDAMFSGDTLFFEECGRCDLAGGDYRQMLESLKRLAGLPGDYRVFPGHGPSSSLSHEREYNLYIRKATAK